MSLSSEKYGPGLPRIGIGAELRAARERLGWELPQAAQSLRIRPAYLCALEEDRVDDLPGAVFGLGFVRSYASLLGLPAEELCRRFREQVGGQKLETELKFPTPLRSRGVPIGASAFLALTMAVAGYAGWYKLSGSRPGEVASVPPVPEQLAPLAEPAQMATQTVALPAKKVVPAAVPAPAIAANDDQLPTASVTPSEAGATSVANTPDYQQAAGTPGSSRIMLHANADSWLQVHDGSGNLLFSRILKAGDSWQVPGNEGTLFLTTGNAGGTDVLVDGKPVPPLGGSGAVRRDVPLDPDALKAGKDSQPPAGSTATGQAG